MNDTQRATKEWDPWLVLETNPRFPANMRVCVFCGWNKIFVRKKTFCHFRYGGMATSEHCKHIPRLILEKFRNCGRIVLKKMLYEEMYGEGLERDDAIESAIQPIVDALAEGPIGPRGRIKALTASVPNLDSVDSTLVTVGRRINTPSISHQKSMDESL